MVVMWLMVNVILNLILVMFCSVNFNDSVKGPKGSFFTKTGMWITTVPNFIFSSRFNVNQYLRFREHPYQYTRQSMIFQNAYVQGFHK